MKPILRWAGGKQKLVATLRGLLPKNYERLVEPMAGGAAMFFATSPRRALLADINAELIVFYEMMARRTNSLVTKMTAMRASKRKYYELRASRPRTKTERALRFAYLNRLCWNGLYRVNKDNQFNVPIGSRLPEQLWDEDHLRRAGKLLRGGQVLCQSFEETAALCTATDAVFFDPPYPKAVGNGLGFNRYSPERFTMADHERLASVVHSLDRQGVRVMIALASKDSLLRLYKRDGFRTTELATLSLIAGNGQSRGQVGEIVVRNYD